MSMTTRSKDVPFDELPDDWVCPICTVDKSFFEAEEGDGTGASTTPEGENSGSGSGSGSDGKTP